MKKSITIVAMLITVIGTTFATDLESKKVNKADAIKVFETRDDVFKLIYPFKDDNTVNIEIVDQKGRSLQTDLVQNELGFTKSYDISELKDGDYSMIIEDGEDKIEKAIKVQNDASLTVKNGKDKSYHLFADFKTKSDLYVNIYEANGELVHHEKIENSDEFARTYNLSNIKGQKFTFEVVGWTTTKRVTTK